MFYNVKNKTTLKYNFLLGFCSIKLDSTLRYLICGALAGMTASTCVYPIDLCKTILAVQTDPNTKYKGIFRTIYLVFQEKGFFALYKGWSTSMIGIAPYASLKLTFFQVQYFSNLTFKFIFFIKLKSNLYQIECWFFKKKMVIYKSAKNINYYCL